MAMRASAMAIRRNTLQARPVARRLSTAVAPRTGVASRPVEGGRPCNPPGVIKEFVTAPVSFGKEVSSRTNPCDPLSPPIASDQLASFVPARKGLWARGSGGECNSSFQPIVYSTPRGWHPYAL
eukprot:COSAG01_NODE_4674_length_4826_cov_5.353501_2_plen_124_part_00